MKKIFKGHLPWGFLGFRHVSTENQEQSRYLTGYIPVKKIHKAASVGDITEVQRMLEFGHVDVNITDRKKRTALHYACAHGQSEMVSLLLWYDCNIEARDCEDSTALIKATQRQHEECVKILLDNGADSNAIDTYQNTALHYSVYNNDTAIASRLLAFNADTEIKAKNGYTPLILAVLENREEMVELLLQAAADINALDNCKRSALIHAVRAQFKNMISLLLQQGADVSLMDVYGATAQSYTVFETFQVLSKGPSSSHLEPTSEMDEHNFDAKDDCTPCTHPMQDRERMEQLPAKEEEDTDTVDQLGSQVALEQQEKELEICEDHSPRADTCPECYSKTSLAHRPRTPEPATEDDGCIFSSKTPVIQSPMFTEANLWIGYPADWPEPVKFSRQPAVYNPIEWREDMKSQSVSLEEGKHPTSVLLGNAQTHEWPARVSKEAGANDSDPTEKENAKDDLVSLSAPLEENKLQRKEFSVTEAAKLQTDVKLKRQGILRYEEMGLETCQESNLEAAESTESCSVLRFSTKPDCSDPETTARKDKCNFDTKDKLEKHLLAQRASSGQAEQSPAPLQLQEQAEEPETNAASDGEDTSGHSRSAEGQVLRGEKLEGKDALQLVVNQKPREIREAVTINVHHEEERPREDCSGETPLKSASPKPACDGLGCEDRDGAAAPVSVTLQTFPGWEEGDLGDVFPSPSSSQVVGNGGQSVTKFPFIKNKLDCENNKSEMEESLHKSKERSSKKPESGKVDGTYPEACMGEKQGAREFKDQMQNTMKPKRMAWPLEISHMPKSSEPKGLSDFKEKTHVSELKGWGDSTLRDTYKQSKGARDFTQKPVHSNCEAPPRTVGTARARPPSGRTANAFADEDLQDPLSDAEFHVLEEEILAWEKVHLENESVSEDLLNKCEGISSDAMGPKRIHLENKDPGEDSDFEVTSQSKQKSLDGSENSQLQDKVLSKTCPQTQNTSADPPRPTHPQFQKESKHSHSPPLHLEKMSEDPKINKKCDGECAPVHSEVPAVRAHEKMSLTQDVTGNNREPDKSSRELQHTAGDVSANICPDKEPLLGSYRGKTQFKLSSKVEEMSKKQTGLELGVSENLCLTVTDYNDNRLIVKRKSGRTQKLRPTEEKDELAKSVPDSCIKEIKKSEREPWTPRQAMITPVFEKSLSAADGLLLVKDSHHLSEMGQDENRLTQRQAEERHKMETQVDQVNKMEEASSRSQPSF